MAELKTKRTPNSVAEYLEGPDVGPRRDDAMALDALLRRTTGWEPRT